MERMSERHAKRRQSSPRRGSASQCHYIQRSRHLCVAVSATWCLSLSGAYASGDAVAGGLARPFQTPALVVPKTPSSAPFKAFHSRRKSPLADLNLKRVLEQRSSHSRPHWDTIARVRGGAAAAGADDSPNDGTDNLLDPSGGNDGDVDDHLGLLATATVLETTTTTVLDGGAGDVDDGRAGKDPSIGGPGLREVKVVGDDGNDDEAVGKNAGASGEVDASAAAMLRAEGKERHDAGDYGAAAELFHRAAALLPPDYGEDAATCRLHEALCRLKVGGTDEAFLAAQVCDDVLHHKDDGSLPNVLVARAFHRRAKAYVELDRTEDALRDARSAAFLGDRKAVALYGKLLRDHPTAAGGMSGDPSNSPFGVGGSSEFSDSSSFLDLLMGASGSNAAAAAAAAGGDSAAGALPFLSSLLPSPGQQGMGGGGGGPGALAQSVLSSLSKRLQDESTQDTICRVLQQTTPGQLTSWAAVAGVPLAERQATQLSALCQKVTPTAMRAMLRWGRRLASAVRVVRLLFRLLRKHRTLLILLCLVAWTKSAVLRPFPASRRQRLLPVAQTVASATALAVL